MHLAVYLYNAIYVYVSTSMQTCIMEHKHVSQKIAKMKLH